MRTAEPFFVVGCPRSGTTLLRAMLDHHPEIAVPPESYFTVWLGREFQHSGPGEQTDVLRRIMESEWFSRWPFDHQKCRETVLARRPQTYGATVSAVFEEYARQQGKRRWGDKTPLFVRDIPFLHSVFPNARFIHVIRDGRQVAASIAERSWGEPTAIEAALRWNNDVAVGRQAGRGLREGLYTETRLEDLVADPEATLTRLCRFIGVQYSAEMLEYPGHPERVTGLSLDPDPGQEQHLTKPPTPGLRDWRDGVPPHEQELVAAICFPKLLQLGYRPALPQPRASIKAARLMAKPAVLTAWYRAYARAGAVRRGLNERVARVVPRREQGVRGTARDRATTP